MKILLTSYSGYGAWFMLRLLDEGHEVSYNLLDKKYEKILSGIVPSPLKTKPKFGEYDLSIFDLTGKPALAEQSMKETPTIGDSDLHSQLEEDRIFGIQIMEEVGINVPPYEQFSNIEEAKRYILETQKKYVFKPFGGQDQDTATTYVSTSPEDLIDYLDKLSNMSGGTDFMLQEIVQGTEVSVEAYFNGEDFFFKNATLEEKKFMNENKGPNTGCAGNLVWAFPNTPRIFEEGLGRMKDWLCEAGFRGMIDLNTIATEDKLYGLEWTPRFGYDASASIFSLYPHDLGQFFLDIASGETPIDDPNTGMFAASVRLSIPPYPSEIEGYHPEDVPVKGLDPECLERCFVYDVMLNDEDELVTAGVSGMVAAPIATGDNIEDAFENVMAKVKNIKIPDMQYRTDIHKTTRKRYDKLLNSGWLR